MKLSNLTPFEVMPMPSVVEPPARSLTVIVKGTFDLVPGGVCAIAAKQRTIEPDRPFLDSIGRSLAWASDLAPFKPHSDFYVLGSFHQPGGLAAPTGEAGFSFGPLRKDLALFGPRLAVQGPDRGWTMTPPEPFVSLPLRWEYSFGGMSDPRNPMGLGIDPAPAERGARSVLLPRIEDRRDPVRSMKSRPAPVNFAPLPPAFQERRRKLGTRDQRWSLFRAPLPPEDYDPSVHNAAPADQQGGNYPAGDEALVLRNLHPAHPLLETRLPGLRVLAAVLRQTPAGPAGEDVAMNLDTVVALPDDNQLVLVWRGVVARTPEAGPRELVALRVEMEPLDTAPAQSSPAQRLAAEAAAKAAEAARKDAEEASQVLAHARATLAKARMPAELLALFETESDPHVLHDALNAHLGSAIEALLRKYPTAVERVPQLKDLLAARG